MLEARLANGQDQRCFAVSPLVARCATSEKEGEVRLRQSNVFSPVQLRLLGTARSNHAETWHRERRGPWMM